MVISLTGSCILRIVWINVMLRFYNVIDVVYVVYVISWIITALAHLTALTITYKKVKKRFSKDNTLSAVEEKQVA